MTEHRLEALSGRRRAGLQLETWDLRLVRAIAIAMSEVSASCSVEPREGGRERVAPSVPEAAASLAPSPARLASGLPEGHASMSAVTRELVLPNWPEASAARHMRARGGAIAPHGHASRRDGWHPPGGHDRRHPGEGVRTALLSSRSGAVAREPIPPEAGVGASRVKQDKADILRRPCVLFVGHHGDPRVGRGGPWNAPRRSQRRRRSVGDNPEAALCGRRLMVGRLARGVVGTLSGRRVVLR